MLAFEEMTASTNYPPFILSKLAISLSIKSGEPLQEADFSTDTFGLELNRQTITGEWDELYKSLIQMFEGHHILENGQASVRRLNGSTTTLWQSIFSKN